MELKINPDFRDLLDPISAEAREALRLSIIKDRLLNPIITWNGTIVDGHNRYDICRELNIGFETIEIDFKDADDAKLWILKNQMARRNMTDYSRSVKALKMKPVLAEKARERMKAGGNPMQNSAQGGAVRDEIAKLAGVSHDTISKVEEIEAAAPDAIKAKVQSGEMSINAAHKSLKIPTDKSGAEITPAKPKLHLMVKKTEKLVEQLFDNRNELTSEDKIDIKRFVETLNEIISSAEVAPDAALDAQGSSIAHQDEQCAG
jgi:transcriptional regulator with XRE-family HTH domain